MARPKREFTDEDGAEVLKKLLKQRDSALSLNALKYIKVLEEYIVYLEERYEERVGMEQVMTDGR
jgi:hypothetical protein